MPSTARGAQRKSKPGSLKDYDDEYLVCREYLHAWDPLGSYRAKAEDGTGLLIEVVRCTRCTTVRERAIDDVFFEIVGNTYYYADGYPVQGGVGPRSGVRKEYHRRHPPIARDSVMPRNLR